MASVARRTAEKTLRWGDISAFVDLHIGPARPAPLMSSSVACGFPSPADDYMDRSLESMSCWSGNPAATFAVRIAGESMTGAGIFPMTSPWWTAHGHRPTTASG